MRRTRFDADPCPIARVADLFGDWWTPIILRDALFGVQRFEDFQKNLDISRATLSSRLTRLVDEGLIEKVAYQQHPVRHEYVLTEKGRAASDVLIAMWRYGEDHFWPERQRPPLELAFRESRATVRATVVDEVTGRPLDPGELRSKASDDLCRPLCRTVDRCDGRRRATEGAPSPAMNGRSASHHGRLPPAPAD